MLIIGLTGGIGMGKSTAARNFASLGIPVYDADAEVHALYEKGGAAVPGIAREFPQAVREGRVDRAVLSRLVLGDQSAMNRLEAITHPLVDKARNEFLARRAREGAPMVVLEIPLLFETGADALVDVVVVVSAPEQEQRKRALSREGMSEEKFAHILSRQWPDAMKRARADFVVNTGESREQSARAVQAIVESLRGREGKAWAARRGRG